MGPGVHLVESFPARFGPFVLLRLIGAGGMGSAYLARHPEVGGLLVVKRLHPELMVDETVFKRFVHEAEVAAHVRHPHVAGVVAMGTVDREPFLATEYVFGIPMAQIIDRVEDNLVDPVPLPIALTLGVELLRGLGAIHGAVHRETGEALGLIHRDIGARNVLVGFDGHLRIIDLGLGKSALSDWQTAHQALAGSPDYMPPEQAMGARVDGRADVYSAAVTLWELLAGRKRIRAESVTERLKFAVSAQPEALRDVRPEASARLEAILKQAMAADPDRRTPTAEILCRTLEEEQRAHGARARTEEVVAWLDTACATIIAKERRLLEQAKGLERRALRPVRAETRFFVQQPVAPTEDPYAAYEPALEPPRTHTGVKAALDRLAESEAAARLSEWVDPEHIKTAPTSTKAVLIAGVIAFMAVVAGLTAWVLTPELPVQVEGLVAPLPPPEPVAQTPERTPPPPEPPELAPIEPDFEPEDPELEDPQTAGPDTRPRAHTTTRSTPKDVLRRKRRLVERLRNLRRQRFEIGFQRKLTQVSAQLSRARTQRALDSVEANLAGLEAE